ncbi:hypothetical protein JQ596_38550 [Bradyrhizobium manausense]|uniref:hypothetical protein n=1 Tax=Bradyrhizobium manausense TaxID=989370 RepID=UPI001BA81D6F|nr:hypothetical protein [Bradyrhizobium manausense]MBR0831422.1 hypothetical protein [Bradyrhizobium manausense]
MQRDALYDELRRIERAVVDGEWKLAQQEAQIVELKRQHLDLNKAQGELERLRANQRQLEQDRQRLLSMLQP